MDEPIYFVADIGGTNARFAAVDANFVPAKVVVIPTRELGDGQNLAAQVRTALGLDRISAGCIAMAGPLLDGSIHITNGQLQLEQRTLAKDFDCPIVLANDFFALAHGVPQLEQLTQLGGTANGAGVKAILGAGSGLGMSALVPLPDLVPGAVAHAAARGRKSPAGWLVLA